VVQYAKWQGQCNSCKEWNTIAEEIIQNKRKQLGRVNQLQQVKHQNLYE
jgi:DNA repair protein RadA/Sms